MDGIEEIIKEQVKIQGLEMPNEKGKNKNKLRTKGTNKKKVTKKVKEEIK